MSISSEESNLTERVGVEVVPERPRRPAALRAIEGRPPPGAENAVPNAPNPEAVNQQIRAWTEALTAKEAQLDARAAGLHRIAALHEAASRLLAIRCQLGFAVIFAFVLALLAMGWQSLAGLMVLIAWCLLAIMPLAVLEWSGRRAPPR